MVKERIAEVKRKTKETDIFLRLNLDGTGESEISSGIPFFDHMLELFARHGLFDLQLKAEGDTEVDFHHTVEDTGIVIGECVRKALGGKLGINRYGYFVLPMDESLAEVSLDLSGRPLLVYRVRASNWFVREFNIGLVREFFQAFANNVGANVHIKLEYGEEPHHIAEAIFKAFARALDRATSIDLRRGQSLPSTKGLLS